MLEQLQNSQGIAAISSGKHAGSAKAQGGVFANLFAALSLGAGEHGKKTDKASIADGALAELMAALQHAQSQKTDRKSKVGQERLLLASGKTSTTKKGDKTSASLLHSDHALHAGEKTGTRKHHGADESPTNVTAHAAALLADHAHHPHPNARHAASGNHGAPDAEATTRPRPGQGVNPGFGVHAGSARQGAGSLHRSARATENPVSAAPRASNHDPATHFTAMRSEADDAGNKASAKSSNASGNAQHASRTEASRTEASSTTANLDASSLFSSNPEHRSRLLRQQFREQSAGLNEKTAALRAVRPGAHEHAEQTTGAQADTASASLIGKNTRDASHINPLLQQDARLPHNPSDTGSGDRREHDHASGLHATRMNSDKPGDAAFSSLVQHDIRSGQTPQPGASGVMRARHAMQALEAMQHIAHSARNGATRIELQLEPAHLGKVHVSLQTDAAKQLQMHLTVEHAASRQVIEQHMPQLRAALADQGLSLGNFSMQTGSQQQQGYGGMHGEARMSDSGNEPDIATSTQTIAGTHPRSTGGARLSIRV